MKKPRRLLKIITVFIFALIFFIGMTPSGVFATKDMFKEAKDLFGTEVNGCKYCHTVALPKEGQDTLSDRGKWLVAEKKKRKADKIDAAWLKDYKEKK